MTALASRAQLRMSFLRWALVTVPLILLLGTLSGTVSGSGSDNDWYRALAKPDFTPEGWVFPVAWTLLYTLQGLALAMILHARGASGRGLAIAFFAAQFLLNLAWSPIFFGLHRIQAALWVLAAMLVAATIATILFARIRKAAGLMMLPYLAWLAFAALLNWQIVQLNPDPQSLVTDGTSVDIAF